MHGPRQRWDPVCQFAQIGSCMPSRHPRDVRAAAKAIEGQVVRTPTRHSRTLSMIAGCEVCLKFENLQFTASFKERGALNRLLALTPEERKRGVAAMSAGNHAQGVAYHAGRLGIPATIVMPVSAPFNKVKHTRDFGATVILEGQRSAARPMPRPAPSRNAKVSPSSIPMTTSK